MLAAQAGPRARDELNDLFRSDVFILNCFKIVPCPKRYNHDWCACPFLHPGERARRRCLRAHTYSAIVCPDMRDRGECPRGDDCSMTHTVFEYHLHPQRYRTLLCKDGDGCDRRVCFFAHSLEELRAPSSEPPPLTQAVMANSLVSSGLQQMAAAAAPAGSGGGGGGSGGGPSRSGSLTPFEAAELACSQRSMQSSPLPRLNSGAVAAASSLSGGFNSSPLPQLSGGMGSGGGMLGSAAASITNGLRPPASMPLDAASGPGQADGSGDVVMPQQGGNVPVLVAGGAPGCGPALLQVCGSPLSSSRLPGGMPGMLLRQGSSLGSNVLMRQGSSISSGMLLRHGSSISSSWMGDMAEVVAGGNASASCSAPLPQVAATQQAMAFQLAEQQQHWQQQQAHAHMQWQQQAQALHQHQQQQQQQLHHQHHQQQQQLQAALGASAAEAMQAEQMQGYALISSAMHSMRLSLANTGGAAGIAAPGAACDPAGGTVYTLGAPAAAAGGAAGGCVQYLQQQPGGASACGQLLMLPVAQPAPDAQQQQQLYRLMSGEQQQLVMPVQQAAGAELVSVQGGGGSGGMLLAALPQPGAGSTPGEHAAPQF